LENDVVASYDAAIVLLFVSDYVTLHRECRWPNSVWENSSCLLEEHMKLLHMGIMCG